MRFECPDDLVEHYQDNANHCFQLALKCAHNRVMFREYMARYETWKLAAKAAIELSDYQATRYRMPVREN
ncbi:hypothetical protein [Scytonema sp. NUACC26]|uniref:hypothetical protein n=1 Tax=Scytonema sp. NUACC26 TaxID=3140176 RepID=UPI0034DBE3AF